MRCKKIGYSIQGTEEDVNKFNKEVLQLSNNKGFKIQKIENDKCTLISELSTGQKDILDSAQKFGYYDYPRRITSEELSQKIGIKKDITLKNLRKAEKHIISRILESF